MIKLTGFDKLQKKLEKMQNDINELNGKSVPLSEMMDEKFMLKYSDFDSWNKFLENSPFKVETKEDFEAIDDEEWDNYVVNNTKFSNWKNMLNTAGKEYTLKKIKF